MTGPTRDRWASGSAAPIVASNLGQKRSNSYFIPRDGIEREVITAEICRYLGNNALVKPGKVGSQHGYMVTAYRNLTSNMIQDLKADSAQWEREKRENARARHITYDRSETYNSRQQSALKQEPSYPEEDEFHNQAVIPSTFSQSQSLQPVQIQQNTVPFQANAIPYTAGGGHPTFPTYASSNPHQQFDNQSAFPHNGSLDVDMGVQPNFSSLRFAAVANFNEHPELRLEQNRSLQTQYGQTWDSRGNEVSMDPHGSHGLHGVPGDYYNARTGASAEHLVPDMRHAAQIAGQQAMQAHIAKQQSLQAQIAGQQQPMQPLMAGQHLMQTQMTGQHSMQPPISGQQHSMQAQITGQQHSMQAQIAGQQQSVQAHIAGQQQAMRAQIAKQQQSMQPIVGQQSMHPQMQSSMATQMQPSIQAQMQSPPMQRPLKRPGDQWTDSARRVAGTDGLGQRREGHIQSSNA